MIATIGPTEIILICVVILILFGSAKIPEFMRNVGKGFGQFKKGIKEGNEPEQKESAESKEPAKTPEGPKEPEDKNKTKQP